MWCTCCVYSKTVKLTVEPWSDKRIWLPLSFLILSFSFFSTIFVEIWRFGTEGEVFRSHQSRQNWRETITFSSKSGRTDCSFQSSILRVPVPTFVDGYVITECVCASFWNKSWCNRKKSPDLVFTHVCRGKVRYLREEIRQEHGMYDRKLSRATYIQRAMRDPGV